MSTHRQTSARKFKGYTEEEYFEVERAGYGRYEFWDGEIYAMAGGRFDHDISVVNITLGIGRQLKGNCRVVSANVAVLTQMLPPYKYPDLSVYCGDPVLTFIGGNQVLNNPVVIVEVLSPSTEKADKEAKRLAYFAIPSLKDYLIIDYAYERVYMWHRNENDEWIPTSGFLRPSYPKDTENKEGVFYEIKIQSINVALTYDDVFAGIDFS